MSPPISAFLKYVLYFVLSTCCGWYENKVLARDLFCCLGPRPSPLKLKLKGKATSDEVASASSAKADSKPSGATDSKPSGSTVQRSDGPSYEEFCQHSASHTEQICCFIAAAHGAFKLVL